jgi:hypothetical protein
VIVVNGNRVRVLEHDCNVGIYPLRSWKGARYVHVLHPIASDEASVEMVTKPIDSGVSSSICQD